MEITTKDQRAFRFKFSAMQQLESCYFAIMMSTQVNKHSNLFAYKYLEGITKHSKDSEQLTQVSFNDVKKIVLDDFERMDAFSSSHNFDLVDFELSENSKKIIVYTKINRMNISNAEDYEGFIVPTGIES